jgi:hypothetical protein
MNRLASLANSGDARPDPDPPFSLIFRKISTSQAEIRSVVHGLDSSGRLPGLGRAAESGEI